MVTAHLGPEPLQARLSGEGSQQPWPVRSVPSCKAPSALPFSSLLQPRQKDLLSCLSALIKLFS